MGRYRSLLVEGTPIGIANTQPALDGEILTSEDLSDMETTRGYKGVKPYISRGHDGVMDGGGEGAVGWFNPSRIRFDKSSGTLYATPESVSDFLKFEIEDGKYHKLSIEYSWTNYGDVPLYDEKGNRISDKSAIRRWYFQSLDETSKAMFGIGDTNIYDGKGSIIKPRSIFKPYLRGVAVLGRATPAYPQFNIAEKINTNQDLETVMRNFKNIAIRTMETNLFKEVEMPTEKQKTVDNTQQNDKTIRDGSYIPFSAIKHSENK